MHKANGWQRRIDYRNKLPARERAWLEAWESEEYECSYKRNVLNSAQATEARQNKARQSRDAMNGARAGHISERETMETVQAAPRPAAKRKTRKERTPLDEAAIRVKAKKRTGKAPTKEQLELAIVAYDTAVMCMRAAKAGDKNTENNIKMAIELFTRMFNEVTDEYAVTNGVVALQRLMGLFPDMPPTVGQPEPTVGEA